MRKNKNRLMKVLLYCLVVCGIIIISLRLYTIYTICIALALRIFQRNSIHRPFQVNMINWLQGFAILYCILPIIQGLFIICVLGLNQVNLYPRLILFQFLDIGLQVLPGLAIIGIAKVFRYGYSLQNEVDQIL